MVSWQDYPSAGLLSKFHSSRCFQYDASSLQKCTHLQEGNFVACPLFAYNHVLQCISQDSFANLSLSHRLTNKVFGFKVRILLDNSSTKTFQLLACHCTCSFTARIAIDNYIPCARVIFLEKNAIKRSA